MISFIVPAHNEERLLGRTLAAINRSAAATGEFFEVIVVDDASTDRTAAIAVEHAARVIPVQHRQIAATRNTGARAARGDTLFFIDADTLINPAAVQAARRALERGAVGGGFVIEFDERLPAAWAAIYALSVPIMRRGLILGGAGLFCTRTAYQGTCGFDERYFASEEVWFVRALRRQGRVVVPRPTVVTSARKVKPGITRQLLRLLFSLIWRGQSVLHSRDALGIWYGPRGGDLLKLCTRKEDFAMTSEFIFEQAPFPSCHASTIVEPEPGKLLAAWFGGTKEGANDVKIWSSRHDGMNWLTPEVAAEEPGQPCWNPVLFKSKAGTLFLFYKAGPSPMTWSGYVRRSVDNGKTWSKPEILPAGLLGPVKNKPIQRAEGTILAGTSVESHKAWACWIERSQDDGRTWRRFGPITVPDHPYGIIQPTLFETKDGRVVMLVRSRGLGVICKSESKDNGETWTPAEKTDLPHPGSGIDLVRTGEGKIFLVYNHTPRFRFPLNLGMSNDDGKTWKMVHTFEDTPGEYSYPAIIQTSDGRLHVTYTWQRTRIKHVVADPMGWR